MGPKETIIDVESDDDELEGGQTKNLGGDGSVADLVEALNSLSPEQRQLASDKLRDAGNKYFNLGDYVKAIDRYTEALAGVPDCGRALANRALCFARLNRHEDALRDANRLVVLFPGRAKGWYRKGAAHLALDQYEAAAQALSRAHAFAPADETIRVAMEHARQAANAQTATAQMYEQAANASSPDSLADAVAAAEKGGGEGPAVPSAVLDRAESVGAPFPFDPNWRLHPCNPQQDWFRKSQRAKGLRGFMQLSGSLRAPQRALAQLCGPRSSARAARYAQAVRQTVATGNRDVLIAGGSLCGVLAVVAERAGATRALICESGGPFAARASLFLARADHEPELFEEKHQQQQRETDFPLDTNSKINGSKELDSSVESEALFPPLPPPQLVETEHDETDEKQKIKKKKKKNNTLLWACRDESVVAAIDNAEHVLLARELDQRRCSALCLGADALASGGAALFEQRIVPILRYCRRELLTPTACVVPAAFHVWAALVDTGDQADLQPFRWQLSAQSIGDWRRAGFRQLTPAFPVWSLNTSLGADELHWRHCQLQITVPPPLFLSEEETSVCCNGIIFWTTAQFTNNNDDNDDNDDDDDDDDDDEEKEEKEKEKEKDGNDNFLSKKKVVPEPPATVSFQSLDPWPLSSKNIELVADWRPTSLVFSLANRPCSQLRTARLPGWTFDLARDRRRIHLYQQAITKAVTEMRDRMGQADRVLSVYCLNSGLGDVARVAARLDQVDCVFSLEPNPSLALIQRNRLQETTTEEKDNGCSSSNSSSSSSSSSNDSSRGKISVVQVQPVDLLMWKDVDRRAHVVVLEAFDCGLLGEGAASVLTRLRAQGALDRHGPIVVPGRARLWARLAQWGPTSIAGVRLAPVMAGFVSGGINGGYEPLNAASDDSPVRTWVSEAVMVREFDFNAFAGKDYERTMAPGSFPLTAVAPGVVHAVVFWFELVMDDNDDSGLLSSSPDQDPQTAAASHWQPSVQWIFPSVRVDRGDLLRLNLQFPNKLISFSVQHELAAQKLEQRVEALVAGQPDKAAPATVAAAVNSLVLQDTHAHVPSADMYAHLLIAKGREAVAEQQADLQKLMGQSVRERQRVASLATRLALQPGSFSIDGKIARSFADQFWLAK